MTCDYIVIILVVILVLLLVGIGISIYFVVRPKRSMLFRTAYDAQIAGLIQTTMRVVLQIMTSTNAPIPDVYDGCSGSTVNRIRFCNHLRETGGFDVGGSVACGLPFQACRSACDTACTACHFVPFISCTTPCKTCPHACQEVYDQCSQTLKVKWGVNVIDAYDIGNTMNVKDFETFSIEPSTEENKHVISIRLPVEASPSVTVDVRSTGQIFTYSGRISLGNLKIIVPIDLYYDCATKGISLKELKNLEVSGVNLNFGKVVTEASLRNAIIAIAKPKLESVVTNVLQDKLTPLFKTFIQDQFLPRLQINVPC